MSASERIQEILIQKSKSVKEAGELLKEYSTMVIALSLAAETVKDNKALRRMLAFRVVKPKEQFYGDDGELQYTSACGVIIDFKRDEVSKIQASLEEISSKLLKEAFNAKEQSDA